MLEEVLIELLYAIGHEVIDLRGDHEASRQDVDRYDREHQALEGQAVEEQRQNVDHKVVDGESGREGVRVDIFVISEGHSAVVFLLFEGMYATSVD